MGHGERQLHHRDRARQLPERNRLQRRLGPGLLPLLAAGRPGSGIYSFSTSAIPAGSYEAKVALNGTWDVNYGAGGVQNGANIAFTVPADGMEVEFQWNSTTKELRVIVGGIQGDLSKAQAYWLSADTIAWNVPTDTVVSLFADPDGALTLDGPGIVAGTNSTLLDAGARSRGPVARAQGALSASREPRGIQAAARCRRGRGAEPEGPVRGGRRARPARASTPPGCRSPAFSMICIRPRPGR